MRKKVFSWILAVLLVFSVLAPVDRAYAAENEGSEAEQGQMTYATVFPDVAFRTQICAKYGFDANNNGLIDDNELEAMAQCATLELEAYPDSIETLEGIELFTGLQALYADNCGLKYLDISANTQLNELSCKNNQIETLDLDVNSLTNVLCQGNPDLIINLGSNDALNKAYARYISQGCPVDDDGVCRAEYYEEDEGSMFPQLVGGFSFSEDATVNYDKSYVSMIYEDTEEAWYYILSEYDADNDSALSDEELLAVTEVKIDYWVPDSLNGMERLVNLEVFEGTQMDWLVYADFSQNTKLRELTLSAPLLTSLDLSANTELTKIDICGCFKTLNICENNKLEDVYISGYEGEESIAFGNLSALKQLWLDDYSGTEIPELSTATELIKLDLTDTAIESLDVSALTKLESLQCFDGALEEISGLQNLSSLKYLNLGHNKLTTLDVSALTGLEDFYCHDNELTSLTVGTQAFHILVAGDNENLQSIEGYENILSVQTLGVGATGITSLDVSKFTNLQYLYCDRLGLDELNLSANTELLMLDCSVNNLEELVITGNTKLFHLYCEDNKFSSLNITNNPKLLIAVRGIMTEEDGVCTYLNGVGGENYFGDDPLENMLSIDADVELVLGDNEPSEEEKATIIMFPDPAFRNYVLIQFDKDFNNAIDSEELEAIAACEEVELSDAGVKDLSGIEFFTGVVELRVGANELTTVNLSRNVKLQILSIGCNNLSTLDITGIPGLIKAFNGYWQCTTMTDDEDHEFDCDSYTSHDKYDNYLELTVDKGVIITKSYTDEEVETIRKFPDRGFRSYVLETFDSNEDYAIDEEEMADIADCVTVVIGYRSISDLTGIAYFTGMRSLDCAYNNLETLLLPANTELMFLDCSHNKLTELDVSANTKLLHLNCSVNSLATLDISEVHGLVRAYVNSSFEDSYESEDIVDGESVWKVYPFFVYYDDSVVEAIDENNEVSCWLYVDKTTHINAGIADFTAVGMVLSDEIGLRYAVTVPEGFELGEDSYVGFLTDSFLYSFDWSEAEKTGDNTYVFTCKLNPLQFTDTVTAQICLGKYDDADMEYLSEKTVTYRISAEEYCNMLEAEDIGVELADLICSLREYAGAVSLSGWSDGNYHSDIDVDLDYYTSEEISSLKEEICDILYEEGLVAQIDLSDSGVADVMISLSLLDKTILNIYVLPEDGVEIYGNESTRYIDGQLYYVFRTAPVGPLNLGKMEKIEISTSAGTASINACPLSYVYTFLCGSSNEAKNLAMITYFIYYESACVYAER